MIADMFSSKNPNPIVTEVENKTFLLLLLPSLILLCQKILEQILRTILL